MTAIYQAIQGIIPILVALFVFSILVIVHEFGHFIVAKKSGICVEEFAIGMGPILLGKEFGETLYSIRLFPIGGFCRMLGEDSDSADERAFGAKSVGKRIAVVAAGPFMNFLFAFFLIGIMLGQSGFAEPVVRGVVKGSDAEAKGLIAGDRILSVDGQRVWVFQDLQMKLLEEDGSPLEVTIKRGDQKQTISITPTKDQENGGYLIGFQPMVKTGIFEKPMEGYEKAGVLETISQSFHTMIYFVRATVVGFIKIFTFSVPVSQISGPIGIIEVVGDTYQQSMKESVLLAVSNMSMIAALLSTNLGAVNLFPIPAMDGGRLVFLFLELIRRNPVNPEKEGMVHFVGFVLLVAFMVFIAFHDITRIIAR